MQITFQGSCLCGTVRYELRSETKAVTHCHCRMCQKAHGAAFGTYGSVPLADFHITAGRDALRSYTSSAHVDRSFCAHCGSPLTWLDRQGPWSSWIAVSLGTLDTPFVPSKQRHAHLASRASWHTDGA